MSRYDAMKACRKHHSGKRYLSTAEFWMLSSVDRLEAYLWLIWPRAMSIGKLMTVCKVPHHGGSTLKFQKSGRIVKVSARHQAPWRFKPQ